MLNKLAALLLIGMASPYQILDWYGGRHTSIPLPAPLAAVVQSLARERLQIDTDLLRIITSAAVELSGGTSIDDIERPCNFDPLGSRSPPYERIKFGYPVENVRFLLLSTNLAREWLEIDTDLLHIITSTADELSGGTNIDDLERP